ncbi:hypothetical protein FA13DRAFT_1715333 [Coprinellus micaceus]|uniref:F-box domain-containing protein n=1 Tax=Coprinellus micaceus TaxID=71717 RepID=A0A4Y7SNU3_COPMI|nr:hypothetical protein FA13DRAFT_1715333 [Coprinellus micaceus]
MPIQTFPPELIRETLKHLDLGMAGLTAAEPDRATFSTLLACTLVSKDFFHETQPLVYSRVDLAQMVTRSTPTSKKLHFLARSLRSNPDLARHVRSFNLTVSGKSRDAPLRLELPGQPSEALAFLLPLFSNLVSLSLQVTDGWLCLWAQLTPSLQGAIAQGFEKNQDRLISVRFTGFGVPAALWLALPNLTSIYLKRNPLTWPDGKNFLGFNRYPGHPDIEQREMAEGIKARVTSFECIDEPYMIAQIAYDAPQLLGQATTVSVEISNLDDPQACLNFWMVLSAASSVVEHLKLSFCSTRSPEPIAALRMKRLRKLELLWDHPSGGYLRSFFVPFCMSTVENSRGTLEEVNISVVTSWSGFLSKEVYLRKELNDAFRRIVPRPVDLRSVTLNGVCLCAFGILCSECTRLTASLQRPATSSYPLGDDMISTM